MAARPARRPAQPGVAAVAPADQRTPAGRLLPVTLAAVSAADTGRPAAVPEAAADRGRCCCVQFPSHPDTALPAPVSAVDAAAAGLGTDAVAVAARRPPPCRARLLVCLVNRARVDAAGGHRRSGRGQRTHLRIPAAGRCPALRTLTAAAGSCGHGGRAMLDSRQQNRPPGPQRPTRNGTAMCAAGQHRHGLSARSVVWGGRKPSVVLERQRRLGGVHR